MKQNKPKQFKPYKRKIHINGEEWSWRGVSRIQIVNSDGSIRFNVDQATMLNVSWYAIERSRYKGGKLHNVTPGIVKNYVLSKLGK